MAAYLVVDTDLTNPELYEQYKLKARTIAEQYGEGDRSVVTRAHGGGAVSVQRAG